MIHDAVDDPARRQAHGDAVADAELARVVGLLLGWHAEECMPEEGVFSRVRTMMALVKSRYP
jgi:hypothetical protein